LPSPGALLGKYRLIEPTGKGASCIVYKAEHTKLPVTVAVKIPRLAEIENTAALREQLRTEAALLAHLNHPNIILLWDYDDDPYPYLVVEFVQGYTFGQVMRNHKRLPPSWVFQMTYHLVKGLSAAHAVGIIHRDLKPENIMVTEDGLVKVADLGLGAVVGNRLLRGVTSISATGLMTGTAAYVAPEQARNADCCDHRADIYSLGATLYHALAGQLPFQGKSVMEVILKHMNEAPRPLTQLVPGLKPAFSDLVLKMLSKAPEHRHQTYEELSAHIRAALKA
jgi:serine/threonine protein kinase